MAISGLVGSKINMANSEGAAHKNFRLCCTAGAKQIIHDLVVVLIKEWL